MKTHVIESNERLLCPEDGLLLGNGDFSVSVYQTRDRIIWRFGKGDVWDRRFDYAANAKPVDIEELRHGIAVERWKSPAYGYDPRKIRALKGVKNPRRMREILMSPPSYNLPYPIPKPVGELALHLPPDLCGMKINQRLVIEEATATIHCSWPAGPSLDVECFIPPSPDVLIVQWLMRNWDTGFQHAGRHPCLRFSLYRWPDPPIREFRERYLAEYRHGLTFADTRHLDRATPLPAPKTVVKNGMHMIEQSFPAEATFPRGFQYRLVPFLSSGSIEPAASAHTREARLHISPDGRALKGCLVVGIATSLSEGGIEGTCGRLKKALGSPAIKSIALWKKVTLTKAADFWSRSSVRIGDPLLENLWYETLHAQRSVFRGGTVPPGLFLPSTINDYSLWHGDYHTNYNIQEPFIGTLATNHPEIMEAYFDACDYLVEIGRTIARDYYHCRGTFIQISGFPIRHLDDPFGNGPISRMVYMTDWITHHYWRYFLCTGDKDFLKARGYPVLRDAALFYTDFLQKGADGLYHAFPSVGGEDPLTGNPDDSRDLSQIMTHIRTCLRNAIEAGEVLGVDKAFRAEWRERLDHGAPDNRKDVIPVPGRTPLQKWNALCMEREYEFLNNGSNTDKEWKTAASWYLGAMLHGMVGRARSGKFKADRDFGEYRRLMERWRHPNGLFWGMGIEIYGHAGAWAETLGVIAPLNEMMVQGYNRIIHVFPNWPKNVDAEFRDFRVEGAFRVSTSWKNGTVGVVEIVSEKGSDCRLFSPWKNGFQVRDRAGKAVRIVSESEGVFRFETTPGGKYMILAAR